jgi:uncharacterized protein YhbP (UPF0306 family)
MELSEQIRGYLNQAQVMQLATAVNNQPWVISVHFAADEQLNLYWLSNPSRRHSQEIDKNPKTAATIPIKFPENPVIGLTVEGNAQIVNSAEAIDTFDKKFGLSEDFKKKLLSGTADEKMFCLRPSLFVLFDQVNYPKTPRQEWRPQN